jgi:hypothetical protein
MRKPVPVLLICLATCLVLVGCSGDDPLGRLKISGKVTLDGTPLDSGTIHFEPLDAAGGSGAGGHGGGGVITDGKYELPAKHGLPEGNYRVSISAPEASDQEPVMGRELPPPAERIPERYNIQSQLTARVTSDGPNTFDFQLESAKLE